MPCLSKLTLRGRTLATNPHHASSPVPSVPTKSLFWLTLIAGEAKMLALRRTAQHPCRAVTFARNFHFTPRLRVKVGDALPDVELMEGSPGTKVNLAKELSSGRGVIVGVPAAYSNNCFPPFLPLTDTYNQPQRPCVLRLTHTRIHQLAETQKCWESLCCFSQRPIRVRAGYFLASVTTANHIC